MWCLDGDRKFLVPVHAHCLLSWHWHHWKETGFVLFAFSIQVFIGFLLNFFFFKLYRPSSHTLLTWEVLWSLDNISVLLLGSFQYITHFCFVFWYIEDALYLIVQMVNEYVKQDWTSTDSWGTPLVIDFQFTILSPLFRDLDFYFTAFFCLILFSHTLINTVWKTR